MPARWPILPSPPRCLAGICGHGLAELAGHSRLPSFLGLQGEDLVCYWPPVFAINMNYSLLDIPNMADVCLLSLGCFETHPPSSSIFSLMVSVLNGPVRTVDTYYGSHLIKEETEG